MIQPTEILEVSIRVQKLRNKLKRNEDINIDYNSYLILCQLIIDETLTSLELSSRLGIQRSSISLILKNLMRKKLIEKQRNFDDERTISLSITRSGIDKVKNITEYLVG